MQGEIAVVNSTNFIKLILTHRLMKKHNVEAVAAAKAAVCKSQRSLYQTLLKASAL